jgi:hypothetical protein
MEKDTHKILEKHKKRMIKYWIAFSTITVAGVVFMLWMWNITIFLITPMVMAAFYMVISIYDSVTTESIEDKGMFQDLRERHS